MVFMTTILMLLPWYKMVFMTTVLVLNAGFFVIIPCLIILKLIAIVFHLLRLSNWIVLHLQLNFISMPKKKTQLHKYKNPK